MSIAVIIPAYNSAAMLAETLRALQSSARQPDELWVVDDASTDDSSTVAKAAGAQVIVMAENAGPSACRNQAALRSTSSVLVFLDADTSVHPSTLARLESHLENDPALAAVIGAYDDAPYDQGAVSQCRNLSHCYVHRSAQANALTFWSGCGAVRRDVFLRMGGFNERYRRPSVEDIEFGYHITAAGQRILLDASIVVKHAKQWTITSSVVTDLRDRGIPWVMLLLDKGQMPNDLNISLSYRLSTAMVGVAFLCLAAGLSSWIFLLAALLLVAGAVLLHAGLFRFVAKKRLTLLPVSIFLFLLAEVCNLLAVALGAAAFSFRPGQPGRISRILAQQSMVDDVPERSASTLL